MEKTDKELTIEVVNTFIQSWQAKSNTTPLKANDIKDLINTVYNTVHSLKD